LFSYILFSDGKVTSDRMQMSLSLQVVAL